jgi:purine-cytosine permease-like protein
MSANLVYAGQEEVVPASAVPEYDVEKNKDVNVTSSADSESHDGAQFAAHDRVKRTGVLWNITNKLSKYGVEERGIERIMPEERTQKSAWGCFWMWLAANCTISTFSLGTLGSSIWYMGFKDSALTILFFNLVFTIPVAFFSTFGPKTGMRQLTLARFSFGYWTVMIPVVLNGIACIGWSTVNSIVGGQALRAVAIDSSMKKIPVEVAIIIIAICTVIFSFAGYKLVHT